MADWVPAPSSSASETLSDAETHEGLEPDEELRARARVSFRGALGATSRSTLSMAAGRTRMRAFDAWESTARAAGFPTAGPEMLLGVTDRRLVVWRTSFFLARPLDIADDMPVERIVDVSAMRHGLVTGLAFVLETGAIVEVESMRNRRLQHLARAIAAAVAERRGGA
ncbi:MAG: hypothetical protein ACRDV7_03305 [Acidimicrobiia bacterium]